MEIVNLSGATLASFQVQGDDTMRNVLLRDQPESELCTNAGYTFVYNGDRSTFDAGFFLLYLGHPRFGRTPQDGFMGWLKVRATLKPCLNRKRARDDVDCAVGRLPRYPQKG